MTGPIAPNQYALAVTAEAGALIPEPTYVSTFRDEPTHEYRTARKFATAADAEEYRQARPMLHGTTVVGPFPGTEGGR